MGISKRLASANTRTNPNLHFNISFLDVVTVTFNMAVYVKVEVPSVSLVHCTLNRSRCVTFDTVKCEVPTIATVMATRDPDIPRIVNMKGGFTVMLLEIACLLRQKVIDLNGHELNVFVVSKQLK